MERSGAIAEIAAGRAIAVGPDVVAIQECPQGGSECDLNYSNDLFVVSPDPADPLHVTKPFKGTWVRVGGPIIPSDAMPLQTVSPDGARLLVALSVDLDVNATPARTSLFTIDLATAELEPVAEFDRMVPIATWSADGQWIAIFEERDLQLVDVSDPSHTILLDDVIPADHYPLAAG
jgi:hypothetical protein